MKILYLFLAIFFSIPFSAFSGECLDSPENYLKMLEIADVNQDEREIFCLFSNVIYLGGDFDALASPTAINQIEIENMPTKELAFKVLPKFLKSTSVTNRCLSAEALAYYQWDNSYEYLIECDNDRPERKSVLYAILGDKRAIPYIIEQYNIVDKRYKKRPIFSYNLKINLLNALYNLPSKDVLPFIEEIIANPRPKNIKERAMMVKQRIIEQVK